MKIRSNINRRDVMEADEYILGWVFFACWKFSRSCERILKIYLTTSRLVLFKTSLHGDFKNCLYMYRLIWLYIIIAQLLKYRAYESHITSLNGAFVYNYWIKFYHNFLNNIAYSYIRFMCHAIYHKQEVFCWFDKNNFKARCT